MEDYTVDTILIMKRQEETSYNLSHYYNRGRSKDTNSNTNLNKNFNSSQQQPQHSTCEFSSKNSNWRKEIVLWTFRVCDYYGIPRETGQISIDYFDRYMATISFAYTEYRVLLVSLATFHLAVKVHETKKIKFSTLAALCNHKVSADEIERMECQVMNALEWRLNPPTPDAFLHLLLNEDDMVIPELSPSIETNRVEIYILAQYMVELSVCDAFFMNHKPSTIAYGAIYTAVERLMSKNIHTNLDFFHYLSQVKRLTNLKHDSVEMHNVVSRYRKIMEDGDLPCTLSEHPNLSKISNVDCNKLLKKRRKKMARESMSKGGCRQNISPNDVTMGGNL